MEQGAMTSPDDVQWCQWMWADAPLLGRWNPVRWSSRQGIANTAAELRGYLGVAGSATRPVKLSFSRGGGSGIHVGEVEAINVAKAIEILAEKQRSTTTAAPGQVQQATVVPVVRATPVAGAIPNRVGETAAQKVAAAPAVASTAVAAATGS